MTIGSRFGTNVHPVTVCLTAVATILLVTVVLTLSTNSTLTLVGAQITGSTPAGIQATGRRAIGLGGMKDTMAVMACGTSILGETVGIRVTGKRLVGIKRTNVITITLSRNGSLIGNKKNEHHHDHIESQWFTHAFFEALSVDQLINSLNRGEGDTTIFTGLEVDPGESLADTSAQIGIIDIRPFRKGEEALFYKFGLKPRVINGNNQAVGIGGKAKVLGKVEMPSGLGGGWTVLQSGF